MLKLAKTNTRDICPAFFVYMEGTPPGWEQGRKRETQFGENGQRFENRRKGHCDTTGMLRRFTAATSVHTFTESNFSSSFKTKQAKPSKPTNIGFSISARSRYFFITSFAGFTSNKINNIYRFYFQTVCGLHRLYKRLMLFRLPPY